MYAEHLHEKMEIFLCTFEIVVGENTQWRTLEAPRIMLEREFMSLVNEAANSTLPIKVKMSRKFPLWNQFDNQWVEQENSITFMNHTYTDAHPEEVQNDS